MLLDEPVQNGPFAGKRVDRGLFQFRLGCGGLLFELYHSSLTSTPMGRAGRCVTVYTLYSENGIRGQGGSRHSGAVKNTHTEIRARCRASRRSKGSTVHSRPIRGGDYFVDGDYSIFILEAYPRILDFLVLAVMRVYVIR